MYASAFGCNILASRRLPWFDGLHSQLPWLWFLRGRSARPRRAPLNVTRRPRSPARRAAGPSNSPASRLSRGPHRVQLHGRHLDRERRRIASDAPHRQHGARDVSALFAGRPLDRVLVEPLRQQRCLRDLRRAAARRASSPSSPAETTSSAGRAMDSRCCSDRRTATARSRTSRRCIRSPVAGGPEKPLPVDWGYYGDFSPDGKSLVFNRHPATWTRKHYRGSYAADLWIADLAQKTLPPACSPTSSSTATGRCGAPTTTSTSSPIRCRTRRHVKPGGARCLSRAPTTSIACRPAVGPARADHEAHERQPVLAVDVGRRQDDRLRRELRRLEARRRVRPHDRDQDRRSRPTTRRTSSRS